MNGRPEIRSAIQHLRLVAVRVQMYRSDAWTLGCRHDCRAGAVSEEDACCAVVPIEEPRHLLGPDHERMPCGAFGNHRIGDCKAVDEAGACRRQVERGDVTGAQPCLQQRCSRWEHHVGGDRRKHDEIEVRRSEAGRGKRLARRRKGHVRGLFLRRRDVTMADAGHRPDPLVARIEAARDLVVGQNLRRQIAAGTRDRAVHERKGRDRVLGHGRAGNRPVVARNPSARTT